MAGPVMRVAVPDVIGEVIRGEHGHDGVRDVLCHPGRYGAPVVLGGDAPGSADALQLLRAKYKPDRNLRAYYGRSPAAPGTVGEPLAVSWSLQSGDGEPAVECLAFPVDPAMPQLEDLARAEHVLALAEELTGTRLPRPSNMTPVESVRYRPGQRHVLVSRLESRSIYLKLDRERSGARAVPTARLVQEALRPDCPDVQAAAPIGFSEADSAALWWSEQGQTLSRLLEAGAHLGPAAVRRASAALRVMHDRISPGSTGGPPASRVSEVAGEASAVLRAGKHVAVLLPGIWPLYGALVTEVVRRLQALPPGDLCFAHGDFKCDNILVHQGQTRILDFDRACWAEPAMDLGKFMADLAWWCPPVGGLSSAAEQAALRAGYGPCDPAVWVRAELWSVLFRLKIAARRCLLHGPAWPAQVRARVDDAFGALNAAWGPR